MVAIRTLQVRNGDCFMVVFQSGGKASLLVIDSGYVGTYQTFKRNLLELIKAYNCDIYILLTHIDLDHIGGFGNLLRDQEFNEYGRISNFYYNTLESLKSFAPFITKEMVQAADEIRTTTKTAYSDAVKLEDLLDGKSVSVRTGLQAGCQIDLGYDVIAHVLSPSLKSLAKYRNWVQGKSRCKTAAVSTDYDQPLVELMNADFLPDENPVNASSISLLIEAFGHRFLFLGDALPGDVVTGLRALGVSESRPLHADLVKLSHHGSRHNTSPELLRLICGDRFLISGQGMRGHPDKETLARVIQSQDCPIFWFNYDIASRIFNKQERETFHIQTVFEKEWRLNDDV